MIVYDAVWDKRLTLYVCLCSRDGVVSLQEYMAFMISRETENVGGVQDVEAAFRALTSGDKPYITAQELYSVSTPSLSLAGTQG
jgi:hypothetical protein